MSACDESTWPRPKGRVRRVILQCNDAGGCLLSGSPQRFVNLDEALDRVRRAPDADTTTIEIWQGGEYVCCFVPPFNSDRRPRAKSRAAPTLFGSIAERWGTRATEIVLSPARAFILLALIAVLVGVGAGLF